MYSSAWSGNDTGPNVHSSYHNIQLLEDWVTPICDLDPLPAFQSPPSEHMPRFIIELPSTLGYNMRRSTKRQGSGHPYPCENLHSVFIGAPDMTVAPPKVFADQYLSNPKLGNGTHPQNQGIGLTTRTIMRYSDEPACLRGDMACDPDDSIPCEADCRELEQPLAGYKG
jgi:hypothetical protein